MISSILSILIFSFITALYQNDATNAITNNNTLYYYYYYYHYYYPYNFSDESSQVSSKGGKGEQIFYLIF